MYYVRDRGSELPEADAYTMLSYENHSWGRIGLAWMSTTCNGDRSMRTSVVEYFQSNVKTAEVCIELNHVFVMPNLRVRVGLYFKPS